MIGSEMSKYNYPVSHNALKVGEIEDVVSRSIISIVEVMDGSFFISEQQVCLVKKSAWE